MAGHSAVGHNPNIENNSQDPAAPPPANSRDVKLEIAVQDPAGARIARERGADRVEACAALSTGGITPSIGLIAASSAIIPTHVLIRPRPGDFCYDAEAAKLMAADVAGAGEAGAHGVVIGALSHDGEDLDMDVLRALISLAHEARMEVTIHRCVDVLLSQGRSVKDIHARISDLGADRVLTSGGAPAAGAGLAAIEQWCELADYQIQAGGGVKIDAIADLVHAGCRGIHLSARTSITGGPSGPGGGADAYDATDPELVTAARAAVDGALESAPGDAPRSAR